MRRDNRKADNGFTLVELLVVIVILGILATVAVFAVRGLTDESHSSACATDLKTVEQAEESNYAQNGDYVSEASLVTNGFLKTESNLHDVTLGGTDGYTISATGDCSATPVSAPVTPPVTVAPPTLLSLGFVQDFYQGFPVMKKAGAQGYELVVAAFGSTYDTMVAQIVSLGAAGLAAGPTIIVVQTQSLGGSIEATAADSLFTGPAGSLIVDPGGMQLTNPAGTLESLALLLDKPTKCVVTDLPSLTGGTAPTDRACLSIYYG